MLLERVEVEGLAHYSYVVGEEGGQVAVVDPERNVERYLDLAIARGLRISHVLETHIHADYASGARDLAERAGAQLALSAYDRGERYAVASPHRSLAGGDCIELGKVAIVARHTPGHTPEHLSFVVYDRARSADVPMLMLSGDFLFVGAVGRPDLLGDEATRGLAERLHESVAALSDLPDGLEIHPAHGAGSLCGAGMSGRPVSTLGYERSANPYLAPDLPRDTFMARLLDQIPPLPPYYLRMKDLNAQGPNRLNSLPALGLCDARALREAIARGTIVIDVREPRAYAAGHIPGSYCIGAGASFSTWAAWVVPPDTAIVLVAPDADAAATARRGLLRVGLDSTVGYLGGGFEAWRNAGLPVRLTAQVSPAELGRQLSLGGLAGVVDVRNAGEFAAGHIPGAQHVMGGFLAARSGELPRHGPLALVCASGYRSMVAASVLERAGFADLVNVTGGMKSWQRLGLPVDHDGADNSTEQH